MTPKTLEDLSEQLADLERRVAMMEVMRGVVKLSTAHLALIWAVLVAVFGVGAGMVRMDSRQSQQADRLVVMSTKLDSHLDSPGHAVSMERLAQMQLTLEEVKRMIEQMHDGKAR